MPLDTQNLDVGTTQPSGRDGIVVRAMISSQSAAREKKLARLRRGETPRVIDLFAGCGGMTLGFQAAGFTAVAAVENDPIAIRSHAANFFSSTAGAVREKHANPLDITATSPQQLASHFGLGTALLATDILIGGPPCQAFARVGRAKLREVDEHPEAFKQDGRANLYLSYLDYIEAFQPLVVVMENVPDVINYGGHNIPEEMSEVLEARGYTCRYTLLNSVHYGVPQMRLRAFLIAYAVELKREVSIPQPTHRHELPRGYKGSRQVALKAVGDLFGIGSHYIDPPEAGNQLPPAVTAEEAISDLPAITLHLEGKLKRGARRFTHCVPYEKNPKLGKYAHLMRNWEGFEAGSGIYDHVIRYLPRDYAIFRRMQPGDQYPEAFQLAEGMLEEEVERRLGPEASLRGRQHLADILRPKIVPPYDPHKFPNKWRKMEPNAPARTLMAHLGKDSYTHIHHDSSQARTISVREAARLQSFPDGFAFAGTMNPAFRQIGNAIPPLMAKAIAGEIGAALSKSS